MNIKDIRDIPELSQKKLAEIIWVSQPAVSRWENYISCPSGKSLIYLQNGLNIPIEDLLEENVSRYNFTETQKKLVNQCLSLNEEESRMVLAMIKALKEKRFQTIRK